MKYSIEWTETAESQLFEDALYIALNTGDTEEAVSFVDKVREATGKLDEMPNRGILPRDVSIRKKGFRALLIGNYAAFYKVYEKEHLVVIEVFASLKEDYIHLLI